jgi:hypothetical protein
MSYVKFHIVGILVCLLYDYFQVYSVVGLIFTNSFVFCR